MIFTETCLGGAYLITPERHADERGFFARTWCQEEFTAHGLDSRLAQCSLSFNRLAGTLRGMHYQTAPYAEAKVVRCTLGAIYDVIIDLRPASPSFKQWVSVELTAANRLTLYIPPGFAHGFQTLCDEAEVFYQISEFYHPEATAGVRWNDPAFGIVWPETPLRTISAKDQAYPDFTL
jgi:dTDP-4-dehydrorhamnose 3,5-epimerase